MSASVSHIHIHIYFLKHLPPSMVYCPGFWKQKYDLKCSPKLKILFHSWKVCCFQKNKPWCEFNGFLFKSSLREHKRIQTTIVEYIKHVWGNFAFSGPSLEGYVANLKLSRAKGVLYCYRLCGLQACWLLPVVCLTRVLFFTPLDGNYSKGTWAVILTHFCKHKLQMTNNQAAYIPYPFP